MGTDAVSDEACRKDYERLHQKVCDDYWNSLHERRWKAGWHAGQAASEQRIAKLREEVATLEAYIEAIEKPLRGKL
jgi:hypothetical protein